MAEQSPIERAARALHHFNMKGQHPKPENYPWEALSRRDQALLRARAYAVIAAIRDSEDLAVLVAGKQALYSCSEVPELADARGCFQAMIDALLKQA